MRPGTWLLLASLCAAPLGPGRLAAQEGQTTTSAMQESEQETAPPAYTGQCATCHASLEPPELAEPALAWASDVHLAAGLTCTGCHGGDALASDETTAHAGIRVRPARDGAPAMCGRCHQNQEFMRDFDPDIRVDQVEVYFTSRHGELLRTGDTQVATCLDCHGTHGIRSSSDATSPTHPSNIPDTCGSCHADTERMDRYGIPTDQLEEYQTSIHWATLVEKGDLSSPVCNDCHGNHGAVPPGHSSVGRVCAECHFQIGEYFSKGAHDSVFVGLDRPGCATCHGNHAIVAADDELLGLGERSTCVSSGCHTDADEGGRVAKEMLVLVDSLIAAHLRSDSILRAAEHVGMPVDEALFELAQVQNAIVGARAIMHMASLDSMRAKIDEGLEVVSDGYESGQEAFAELRVRRTGLAVSAIVILLLILGLLIKIRDLGTA